MDDQIGEIEIEEGGGEIEGIRDGGTTKVEKLFTFSYKIWTLKYT